MSGRIEGDLIISIRIIEGKSRCIGKSFRLCAFFAVYRYVPTALQGAVIHLFHRGRDVDLTQFSAVGEGVFFKTKC